METLSLSSNELTEISLEALVDALGGGHGNLPGAQWDSRWIRGVATGCNGLQHLEIAQAMSEAQRQQHRA